MPQICQMRRHWTFAALLLATTASVSGGGAAIARFERIAIEPATAYFYSIASVTMTFKPFIRQRSAFSSTYSARVFPYFFFSEKGRIWIVATDEELRRVDRGEAVDFAGLAFNSSGEERRIEGHATPTGPSTGRIRVLVFVTKRIVLTYDTTYELKGSASAQPAVTPK